MNYKDYFDEHGNLRSANGDALFEAGGAILIVVCAILLSWVLV